MSNTGDVSQKPSHTHIRQEQRNLRIWDSRIRRHGVLVIDPLDKCEGSNHTQFIVQLLATSGLFSYVASRVSFTSRPQMSIQYELAQVRDAERREFVLHKVFLSVIDHDIRLFLDYSPNLIGQEPVQGLGWPGADVHPKLGSKCKWLLVRGRCG
jgi:hypothetical protein